MDTQISENGQEEIINNLINKKDCLAIMPTGAGKSVCYQIPALIFSGITIVISPLISLMKDQVDSLNNKNIPSIYINSSLSFSEYNNIINNSLNGKYKLIYIAPERLKSKMFIIFLKKINISMIAIDEAHCISQWGHTFRKSYLDIPKIISELNYRPTIAAFTATATEFVQKDIIKILNLNNPFITSTGFDRKNLSFNVVNPNDKKKFILNYLNTHKKDFGIIYCLTRRDVDLTYYFLKSNSFNVSKYHGGMNEKQRNINQNNFILNKCNIMVATNAFGMGIDKPNIRYVIHNNMPKDIESYYQEAGRAGRDELNSECFLLFSKKDILINKSLIEHNLQFENHFNDYIKLNKMIKYCTTKECLRKYILEYFGEHPSFNNCNNCSNCRNKSEN